MLMFRFATCIFVLSSTLITAEDPCRFEHKSLGVVDLSSAGHKDGTAAFPDEGPVTSNYLYSYNPCKPFSEGTECKDVAVCQVSKDGKLRFPLGTQDSIKWTMATGFNPAPIVQYSFGVKKVTMQLTCTNNTVGELEALGEDPINTYKFRFSHKCVCWNACKGSKPSGGGGGIGPGAVFIIILLVLAVVYLVGFAVFYRVRHQRRGLDLIAHRTLWMAVPVYARDGVVYLFRRVTGKGDASYQSV